MHEPGRMSMDERAARRVILAQAIEAGDAQARLLSQVERDQIDAAARAEAAAGPQDAPLPPQRFLELRAQRVLRAIEGRNPALAALEHPLPWQRWATVGLPLAGVALGVLTDAVANPHRVDLVSLPLLAIVGWNLLMYAALLVGWLAWGRRHPRLVAPGAARRPAGWWRWRWRGAGRASADVQAFFHLRWQRAAQSLSLHRAKQALHLGAAGWAVGVALSLLARGLVVEYRVGWESTFLDARQVHAILSLLRLPARVVFPFEPFSVQEVAALQFSQGGGALGGARWVLMYVALLLVLVIVPRLLLALWSAWRARALARQVPIDASDPYFRRVLSLLTTTQVQLCIVAAGAAQRDALLRVLAPEDGAGRTLLRTPQQDTLRLLDATGCTPPPPATGGWLARVRERLALPAAAPGGAPADPALAAAREADVALVVVAAAADLQPAQSLLQWLGTPALLLADPLPRTSSPGVLAACLDHARGQPLVRSVLSFDEFARCWVQERVLLDAIGRCLPQDKQPGFERIAAAWEQRNELRLHHAMTAVAEHLLYAARQVQEVPGAALSVRSLVPAERQARAQARQAAMDDVLRRLDASAADLFARLAALHGVPAGDGRALQHRLQERFVVQQAVDGRHAGVAGAASGAAMGASVDLLVGGLTLGAATALGALVGGSAAYLAAAWKNRTAGGATIVQLSDEMLRALAEAALLRYVALVHHARGAAAGDELPPAWEGDVVAAVEAHRERFEPFWIAARTQPDPARLATALARELEAVVRELLRGWYPPRPA